jgi:hypothetical protein
MTAVRTRATGLLTQEAAVALPVVTGLGGVLLTVKFRGERVQVLAEDDPMGIAARPADYPAPVTDPWLLELATGLDEAPCWPRPVRLHAIVTERRDPLAAVGRASRWASYGARVAVAPARRIGERARVEAAFRGVWLVSAKDDGVLMVVDAGETVPSRGSARLLMHRLLDELVWEELITREIREGEDSAS